MQKKWDFFWSIKKKAVLLHAFSPQGGDCRASPCIGAPGNFNFWGEREQGENSYERHVRESY